MRCNRRDPFSESGMSEMIRRKTVVLKRNWNLLFCFFSPAFASHSSEIEYSTERWGNNRARYHSLITNDLQYHNPICTIFKPFPMHINASAFVQLCLSCAQLTLRLASPRLVSFFSCRTYNSKSERYPREQWTPIVRTWAMYRIQTVREPKTSWNFCSSYTKEE